ncbi:MAG: hypothetical protein AB1589_16420 [Cyanobacteriota bacterium]
MYLRIFSPTRLNPLSTAKLLFQGSIHLPISGTLKKEKDYDWEFWQQLHLILPDTKSG